MGYTAAGDFQLACLAVVVVSGGYIYQLGDGQWWYGDECHCFFLGA